MYLHCKKTIFFNYSRYAVRVIPGLSHNLMHLQNPSLLFGCLFRIILRWHSRQFFRVVVGFVLETYSNSLQLFFPLQMSSSQKNHTSHRVGVLCYSDISVVAPSKPWSSSRKLSRDPTH